MGLEDDELEDEDAIIYDSPSCLFRGIRFSRKTKLEKITQCRPIKFSILCDQILAEKTKRLVFELLTSSLRIILFNKKLQ